MSHPKSLIIVPYANIDKFNTGTNIRNNKQRLDTYLKNCCVACISARKNCKKTSDIALVTNIEIPSSYKELLKDQNVKIINCPFNTFSFDAQYTWSLAFYKLCALKYVVENYEYANYAYLDSDVYVQDDFELIWRECSSHILMYDINHGLRNGHYQNLLEEYASFYEKTGIGGGIIPHYGGEFFAANKADAQKFIALCEKIYESMKANSFTTTHGDEFITSLAANLYSGKIHNAGAYVFRFWTGIEYRLISTCYHAMTVLHVPAEKEFGMLKIYSRYIRHGKLPTNSQVYKLLHISHMGVIRYILTNKTIKKYIVPTLRNLRSKIHGK